MAAPQLRSDAETASDDDDSSRWGIRCRFLPRRLLVFCLIGLGALRNISTTISPKSSSVFIKGDVLSSSGTATKTKNARESAAPSSKPDQDTKYILYYTPYWFKPDFQFGVGRQPFLDYNCPVHNCWAQPTAKSWSNHTNNATTKVHSFEPVARKYSDYDAVLISVQANDRFELNQGSREEITSWRQSHQRFVFVNMESQSYSIRNLTSMNAFFNWTMTFKWDSDIPRPYGWFQPKEATTGMQMQPYASRPERWVPYHEDEFIATLSSRDDTFQQLARRPGKVAWIVSHCETDSLREDYVFHLRRHGIEVDEFGGRCRRRSPSCDKPYTIAEVDNCTKRVQQDYKFYLAFENSFCNDYVTEKFFGRMENAVVITLGQANYSEIAPPHSSINILDFDSVQAVAKYIQELDHDDTKYLSYFWWKDYYSVKHPYSGSHWNNFGQSMCRLCEKLHDPKEPIKVYNDVRSWWRQSAECGMRLPGLKVRMAAPKSKFSSGAPRSGNTTNKALRMFSSPMRDHLRPTVPNHIQP